MSYQINGVDVIDDSRNANLVSLQLTGTGALKVPVGTSLQRPASPTTGQIRYNSSTGSYESYNGITWGPLNPPSIINYVYTTSNFTMADNTYVFADTSQNNLTLTLPANPSEGTVVYVADYSGTFSVNSVTINRNNSTILEESVNVNLQNAYEYTFYYINSDWRIFINKTTFLGVVPGTTPIITGSSVVLSNSTNEYRIQNYAVSTTYSVSASAGLISDFNGDTFYYQAPSTQVSRNETITVTYDGVPTVFNLTVIPLASADDDVILYSNDFETGTTSTGWQF